jgi:hypothetical protein
MSITIKKSGEEVSKFSQGLLVGDASSIAESLPISFGIVTIDKHVSLSKFGTSENSYGIFHDGTSSSTPTYIGSCVDGNDKLMTLTRALTYGDVLSLFICANSGVLFLGINDGELIHRFEIPKNKSYILGATVSRKHNVSIFMGIPSKFVTSALGDPLIHATHNVVAHRSDSRIIENSMASLITQMCQKRFNALKKRYINSNKNYIDYNEENPIKPKDTIAFGTGIPSSQWEEIKDLIYSDGEKCSWLCLPCDELPIFMEQYFQDLSIVEIFDEKFLVTCWRNVINSKLGLKYEAYPTDLKSGERTSGKRTLGGDVRIYPEIIPDPKSQIDVKQHLSAIIHSAIASITSNESKDYNYAHQVVKFMKSLALSVDKNISKKKKDKKVVTKQAVAFSNEIEETFGDEVEYIGPEESETLLIIQSSMAELSLVTLCCYLLADMDTSRHILIDTLLLANYLLMNAINQQEDKSSSETNIQGIFMDVIVGTSNAPIEVGASINRRLTGLRQDVMALKGIEQTHVLYISKQILLFVQRMCGMYPTLIS